MNNQNVSSNSDIIKETNSENYSNNESMNTNTESPSKIYSKKKKSIIRAHLLGYLRNILFFYNCSNNNNNKNAQNLFKMQYKRVFLLVPTTRIKMTPALFILKIYSQHNKKSKQMKKRN